MNGHVLKLTRESRWQGARIIPTALSDLEILWSSGLQKASIVLRISRVIHKFLQVAPIWLQIAWHIWTVGLAAKDFRAGNNYAE